MRAMHDGSLLVNPQDAARFDLHPGDNEIDLLFDPLIGVSGQITGDEVVRWLVRTPDGLRVPSVAAEDIAHHQKAFGVGERANLICALFCPELSEGGRYTTLEKVVAVNVLTARRGWLDLELQLKPIANLGVPEVVDVAEHPVDDRMVRFMASYITPKGHALDLPGVYIILRKFVHVEVPTEHEISVPSGSYRLHCRNPFIERSIADPDLDLAPDRSQPVIVDLKRELVEARIRIHDSYGLPVAGRVVIKASEARYSLRLPGAGDALRVWLPRERVSVAVRIPGCDPKTIMVDCRNVRRTIDVEEVVHRNPL